MYDFLLIWDWYDENTGELRETAIECYRTKVELMVAYANARTEFKAWIDRGRLFLSGAVNYSWADIDRLF